VRSGNFWKVQFSGKSETKEHLIRCKTGKLRDLQGVRSGNFWKVQFAREAKISCQS